MPAQRGEPTHERLEIVGRSAQAFPGVNCYRIFRKFILLEAREPVPLGTSLGSSVRNAAWFSRPVLASEVQRRPKTRGGHGCGRSLEREGRRERRCIADSCHWRSRV